jgi:hypothetical protein
MFQLFVEGGVAGASDRVYDLESDGRVLGTRFVAGAGGRDLRGGVVFCANAASFPGAVFMQQVPVPADNSLAMEIRADNTAVTFSNDTGAAISPSFDIVAPSSGSGPDTYDTPAVPISAGGNVTIFSPDGSDYANLVFALDDDGDGKAEQFQRFKAATGAFVPWVSAGLPYLRLAGGPMPGQNGLEILLVQPQGYPDWKLESSDTLDDDWMPVDPGAITTWHHNGEIFHAIPLGGARRFYRLAGP